MSATPITLTIDGVNVDWQITRLRGSESLNGPFRFAIDATPLAASSSPSLADLIAKKATLEILAADGSHARTLVGSIDEARASFGGYAFVVASKLADLEDAVGYRVFVGKTAIAIAESVLADHHLTIESRVQGTPRDHDQRVQQFEDDLSFVRRVLAREGYSFHAPIDRADAIVIVEPPRFLEHPAGVTLDVAERAGLHAPVDSVFDVRIERRVVPAKASLSDYDLEKPMLDLLASAPEREEALELFEFPGGYDDPTVGKALAQKRLDEARAREVVLFASTTFRACVPGYVLALGDGAVPGVKGHWLVLAVEHELLDVRESAASSYVARIEAVPAKTPYRPARAPEPRAPGVQTATITGPTGSEIHTEQHGRIKAKLRWDRSPARDDKSSAWMRVVQPPMSGGFLLPRGGWEELVGFYDATSDQPFTLGRLYNGEARPPSGLPANKVVSAFGTATTPGGGSGNLIQMTDTAGSEGFHFGASKDMNERTENDKVTGVHANDTHTVGASRKLIVGQVHELGVEGAQSYTIGATRTVNLEANKSILAASESLGVGALRLFNVGGDSTNTSSSLTRLVAGAKVETAIEHQNRIVTGAATVLVGSTWKTNAAANHAVQVGGASTELVAGAKAIKAPRYGLSVRGVYSETLASRKTNAGADRNEKYGATASYAVAGSVSIKGADVEVKATSSITLKASGITVKIDSSSVTIDGQFKGDGDSGDSGNESYD